MSEHINVAESPKISIAPMVDVSDRHFRYFLRLITKKSLIYSEMITTFAIKHGDRNKILDFDSFEKPLALQIAGTNAKDLYEAVKIAEAWDYDEINLNVGCPSDRVAGNEMGAVLMAYPELVAEMVASMKKATKKPITVKHRIGIEGKNVLPRTFDRTLIDRYEDLEKFVTIVSKAGAERFTIHARIAILEGLSPRENREIPPLRYEDVYRLKRENPNLKIELNGGIKTVEQIEEHLKFVDGVMIGRAAYENPFLLTHADKFFNGGKVNNISRREILEKMIPYIENMEKEHTPIHLILNHLIGLFFNKKGSKQWKQQITPPFPKDSSSRELLQKILLELPQEVLDERPLSLI